MQIFFSVLSAILAARVIEWLIIATVKTYKEDQEIKKAETSKRSQQ